MEHSETIQKFAFEGPLSLGCLIALGLVVASVIAIFGWRDIKASSSRKLFVFVLLARLAALLVVLWMLAGPSMVTELRKTKPKSVVILVDASASMGLIDPVDGSGSTVRWSAAQAKLKSAPVFVKLDEVIGTLQSARSALIRIRQLSKSKDAGARSQQLWEQVHDSVDTATEVLARLASGLIGTDSESSATLGRISGFLKESEAALPVIETSAFPRTTRPTHQAQEDQLDAVNAFIESGLQRVERLSQQLAARYERAPASGEKAGLAAQSVLTRKEKVATWLEGAENSWVKELEGKARVLRYTFASTTLPVADHDWRRALTNQTGQTADATDLSAALDRAAQDAATQPVDAVVMVTDGGHNAGRDPREQATALRGVPVHIIPIGTLEVPRDVILHHTHCPRAVFKNDTVLVDAMVTAYGCEGEQLQVELSSDGIPVESQSLTASSKFFDGRINFKWKAVELGRHVLRVRVAPLPHERSTENNEARAEVDVMEDTIRVLIADNLPRWEFRYLVSLFKRDKHVEFEQLIFEPNDDAKNSGTTPSFPRSIQDWRRYQVVILGDVSPEQLPPAEQELLRKYVVEEGGNLIVIAGESAMPVAFANQPLGDMIPAVASVAPIHEDQGLGLVVTAEGSSSVATQVGDDELDSERIWREMSSKLPVYNLSSVSRPKPTSHVLISAVAPGQAAEQKAFLCWQYIGLGRVIYLAAPITYQLRYRNGDLYHHRFWGQLLRWAIAREMSVGSKTVHLATDKNSYEQGDQAQVEIRLSEADGKTVSGGNCSVEAKEDGRLIKVIELHEETNSPGVYQGIFSDLPAGAVTLRATGRNVLSLLAAEKRSDPVERVINVDPQGAAEMRNPLCNLPLLNQIANACGGSVIPPASVQNALANLDVAPDVQDTLLSRAPLWNRWGFLWIFVGCLTLEWVARKYCGMV
jgi:hypothetical protein